MINRNRKKSFYFFKTYLAILFLLFLLLFLHNLDKLLIKFEEALYGTSALEKWQSVLAKNPDLNFIRDNCAVFLYGPLTSCAVERLFSILKSKLDNYTNMKSETIYKHLFMQIN